MNDTSNPKMLHYYLSSIVYKLRHLAGICMVMATLIQKNCGRIVLISLGQIFDPNKCPKKPGSIFNQNNRLTSLIYLISKVKGGHWSNIFGLEVSFMI